MDETPVFDDDELKTRTDRMVRRPILAESWVAPASSVKGSFSGVVPLNRPRVTVVAKVAFARGDRLRTSAEVEERPELGPCRDVRAVRLEEESRLKSLAQAAKYLVCADRDGDGGLNYYFDPGPDVDCPKGDASLAEYFGTAEVRQVLDVWLTRPAQGAASPQPAGG